MDGQAAGPRVCVTLMAPTAGAALELARRARDGGADLVEYRLDALAGPAPSLPAALREFLGAAPLPAVVTFRRPRDGGAREEEDARRMELLREALGLGAAYVDVELGLEAGLAGVPGAEGRLVVSHHDFESTPRDLAGIARRIESGPAAVVKLATMATKAEDAFVHYRILREARKPTVSFAMGPLGAASRVLALRFGAPWTYAALEAESAAAPGQIALGRLAGELRARRIGPRTAVYGVIGHPVGHSMSPAMLGAAFEAEGVDAVYLPFDVEADPAGFVRGMAAFGAQGFSVTIPHKLEVMSALDETADAARRVGAANTVSVRDGRLLGTNTDLDGALDAIAEEAGGREGLRGRQALVLGAGGAARAIVFGLAGAGARVSLTDVVPERADELARAAGARALAAGEGDPSEFDIVANATPVGMHPRSDEVAVDTARLREGQIVFDAVYNPLETRLLREARARGARAVRGVEMFVRQGAAQFSLWTGRPAPVDIMRKTVLERLDQG